MNPHCLLVTVMVLILVLCWMSSADPHPIVSHSLLTFKSPHFFPITIPVFPLHNSQLTTRTKNYMWFYVTVRIIILHQQRNLKPIKLTLLPNKYGSFLQIVINSGTCNNNTSKPITRLFLETLQKNKLVKTNVYSPIVTEVSVLLSKSWSR